MAPQFLEEDFLLPIKVQIPRFLQQVSIVFLSLILYLILIILPVF